MSRRCTLLLSAALVFGVIAGCDDAALEATAELGVEPHVIDFGRVPTGETRTALVTISNTSPSGSLTVFSVALAEASSTELVLEGPDRPVSLGPGQSLGVVVRYRPNDGEPDAGAVEISSNALGGGFARVPITSGRTLAKIAVTPESLDLGSIAPGNRSTETVRVTNRGEATLHVVRASLRTDGFAGEVCTKDGDCRDGRCTPSRTGMICALPCGAQGDACPSGYTCTLGPDGTRACLEDAATAPPIAARGFLLAAASLPALPPLLPDATTELSITYAPSESDRGSAQLVLESDDVDRPAVVVPLVGRPDNLPPVASAAPDGPLPSPITPGTRVALTSEGSYDPEGGALMFAWRFVTRPEGSRASFEDQTGARTAFTVDLPGTYVVHLEARDPTGLSSTNDARVTIDAGAGTRVRAVLTWDRSETDLDLHVLAPSAPLGSLGDCFFDNPTPDFAPPGPDGDPTFTIGANTESVAVTSPGDGVYTIVVRVVSPSPRGATMATFTLYLDDVEAFVATETLPTSAEEWDVATLTWPSGRLTPLDAIH